MKKGWTTTKLIAVGSIAALQFVITLPIKGTFVGSGNNPLGAIFYLVTGPIFSVVTLLLIQQFGCLTIKSFLETLIGLPFPHVYPFPFFLFLGPITGFILDSLFYLVKTRKQLSSFIIGGTDSFIEAFWLYLIFITVGYAHAEKLPSLILESIKIIPQLIFIFAILIAIGSASGYLGYLIYQRIKNTAIVKRIQA